MMRSVFALISVVALVAGGARAVVADERPAPHPNVTISSNADFTAANGVRSGNGTKAKPFVISGWEMRNITIKNTDKWVTIRNNAITGRLVLDWIGDRVNMHHNVVNDMRLNQNVRRTGMPTDGVIVRNRFRTVGQLRHWDGLFADNVVGDPNNLRARSVNFDGFNGARFVRNTIYGHVDARLHGHHHSSGWGEATHDHSHETPAGEASVHRYRYHEVTIAQNLIRSTSSYGLAYLDTAHALNDRRAPSEQDPNLNKPHVHFTKVNIAGNRLDGAGILVNVFQANDNLHPWFVRGYVDIRDNRIRLDEDRSLFFKNLQGIEVLRAQAMTLRVIGNSIAGWRASADDPMRFLESFDNNAGILLNTIDDASISIIRNSVANRINGVRATQMTPTVHWTVKELKTSGVDNRVSYNNSVANKPD